MRVDAHLKAQRVVQHIPYDVVVFRVFMGVNLDVIIEEPRECSKIIVEEIRRFTFIVREDFCYSRQERYRRESNGIVHLAVVHDY